MPGGRRFFITDRPDFTSHISRLVSMMMYARQTTVDAVRNLSIAQLDERPVGFGNSISALLEHFAAIESVYQVRTFENRWFDQDKPDEERWRAGAGLGARGFETAGRPLEHYVTQLEQVRAFSLAEFSKRDDAWLEIEFEFIRGANANHHWCWFHVLEDEINHRGQIRLIRKNLTT